MAVQYLLSGGLQTDASNGIRFVLGYDSIGGGLTDSTTLAPRSGLRGLKFIQNNGGNPDIRIPGDLANNGVFAVSASRTHLSLYLEHGWDDLSTVTGEYQSMARINFATSGTKFRELRFVTSGSGSLGTTVAGASDPNTTNTTLVDTRKNFVTFGVTVGMWVECNLFRAQVTSITTTTNPNDTLNFSAGWTSVSTSGTNNPGNLKPYTIWTDWGITYQVYDDAATLLLTSAFISISQVNTLHTVELSYIPVAAGPSTTKLVLDGTVQSTTIGTNIDPTTNVCYVDFRGTAGKTSNWRGNGYYYNGIIWDNLGSGTFSGAWTSQYQSSLSNRWYVTFLPAKSGTGTQFDAWTKSTGTDPGVLVADVSSRPNTDSTTYLQGGGVNTKQSWKHEAHGSALYPIGDFDTVLVVMPYVGASRVSGTPAANYIAVSLGDGTNESASQSAQNGSTGSTGPLPNPPFNLLTTAPDATAWSPSKLDNLQTVVKQLIADATAPKVYSAGILVLGQPGVGGFTPNAVALVGNGVGIV